MAKITGEQFIGIFREVQKNVDDLRTALKELGHKADRNWLHEAKKDKRKSVQVLVKEYELAEEQLRNIMFMDIEVSELNCPFALPVSDDINF